MHPRRFVALLGPLLLAACGPTADEIAGAVLFFSPVVYLAAMWIVSLLHAMWRDALPDVNFGRGSHVAAVALFFGLALYGAGYADAGLFGADLWLVGSALLTGWLLLARLTLRSGWGFRWGGLVINGLLTAPMLLDLLTTVITPEIRLLVLYTYFCGGGAGLIPLLLLIVMLIEAARGSRAARAAARR
ncbi:hypothetical protein [Nannocystis punicea]|uniref:DUF1097 domain-containing protein n=1 Tax=Nannocystis punicea TaxID=2995304 RepID=A0ABY7GVK0_9BACT|nr:hypothetical protein [Nannocystis poenicansa]WAS90982.1 hypothetical protein O0S08_32740 [Nannocystis poenicansa]